MNNRQQTLLFLSPSGGFIVANVFPGLACTEKISAGRGPAAGPLEDLFPSLTKGIRIAKTFRRQSQ
jgi:hypothetical protein